VSAEDRKRAIAAWERELATDDERDEQQQDAPMDHPEDGADRTALGVVGPTCEARPAGDWMASPR
jgi:hypothetical protein